MYGAGGTGADPLLEVLVAQLVRNGTLQRSDIGNMARRLDEGGDEGAAMALRMIVLSDEIDDPKERRAALYSIDGGNDGKDQP